MLDPQERQEQQDLLETIAHSTDGLTKREHFAGMAMQELTKRHGPLNAAAHAVRYADELIRELASTEISIERSGY
jgi:hypothetical protein